MMDAPFWRRRTGTSWRGTTSMVSSSSTPSAKPQQLGRSNKGEPGLAGTNMEPGRRIELLTYALRVRKWAGNDGIQPEEIGRFPSSAGMERK